VQVATANRETEQPVAHSNGNGQRRHNLQLLMASLQSGAQKLRGVTIVLTSPARGEGVSHVAQLFAIELARHTCRRTLIIDAERLRGLHTEDYLGMPQNCHRTNIENVWMLPAKKRGRLNGNNGTAANGNGETNSVVLPMPTNLLDNEVSDPFDYLRVSFDNILIDCRPLKYSSEAAVLASTADGVVVVVEAGRTRHEEILNAQRTIEVAGGKLLGFVLNKRRYPVPEWLYRRL
jgi:Mrp family chromosome partitioning ATPase